MLVIWVATSSLSDENEIVAHVSAAAVVAGAAVVGGAVVAVAAVVEAVASAPVEAVWSPLPHPAKPRAARAPSTAAIREILVRITTS